MQGGQRLCWHHWPVRPKGNCHSCLQAVPFKPWPKGFQACAALQPNSIWVAAVAVLCANVANVALNCPCRLRRKAHLLLLPTSPEGRTSCPTPGRGGGSRGVTVCLLMLAWCLEGSWKATSSLTLSDSTKKSNPGMTV